MLYYTDDSWVPECAVFDCDGIMLDSEVTWLKVQRRLAEQYGVVMTAELEESLVGSAAADFAAALANLTLPEGATDEEAEAHAQAVLATVHEAEDKIIEEGIEEIPGAKDIVRKLSSVMPVAVASNSSSALLANKMKTFELAPLLTSWVGANDIENPKPAPDMYLEAIRRLEGSPEKTVTFEDSTAGATAAMSAGTRTFVFVRDADSPEGAPRGKGYFSSFEDPEFIALVDSWVAARAQA